MNFRPLATFRWRESAIGVMVLVVAFLVLGCQTIAKAQGGRATNQRAGQGMGSLHGLNPNGTPQIGGTYAPLPVKDPTATERALVAARVYQSIMDEWAQRAMESRRPGPTDPDVEARSQLELTERLGPWSLRWQEAQDNSARSRAARYQALSDHLERMSALADGRFKHETGQATGGSVGPPPSRGSAAVARFFRPIDEWHIDQIVPDVLISERPLNPLGVAVTPAELDQIADRVYHAILDEAVDRLLASPRGGETRADEVPTVDAPLAERLGFWSDLWSQSQELAATDPLSRSPAVGDRSARVPTAGVRTPGPSGRLAAIRSHIERMRELENGRFVDDALKRSGRTAQKPVDWSRSPEFVPSGPLLANRGRESAVGRAQREGHGIDRLPPGRDRGPDLPRDP